jgi:hypothetical protein
LAGFLWFLSFYQVLVDQILTMECPWGVPTIPKVLCKIVESIGSWIWRSWPVGAVHPKVPRRDRSDWCSWPVWPMQALYGIYLGWTSWCVPCCHVLLLFSSW